MTPPQTISTGGAPAGTRNLDPRHQAAARRVAVEELSGLALQERGLTTLLARQVAETAPGPARTRLQRHLDQSRRHARAFDERVSVLRGSLGPREALAGVLRSGFAALGTVGATAAQVVTAPLGLLPGGARERVLENAGVEGAALANKLVILSALREALAQAGEAGSYTIVDDIRTEALATWEALLEQAPETMAALVSAR
jgi:hypothetical protein